MDWYPWGDAAFDRARAEDKPVFLSIGYATCHWCHVMEHESFEDPALAAYLNTHFVCVKVDREERPDIDQIYMAFTQAFLGGGGGWPMSVWCTADRRPFFAGTYFPPDDRFGRPGFRSVLEHIQQLWTTQRDEIRRIATTEVPKVFHVPAKAADPTLTPALCTEAVTRLDQHFDAAWGGWGGPGGAPKFPSPHQLHFLLRQHYRTGNPPALAMVTRTLDAMALGGIHDHIGGGFHRYATDREWLVPHFEKMLYDQAGLLQAYIEANRVTGAPRYADVARDIVGYVLRDLQDAGGAFHSAEDADSEGEEGRFYVWTRDAVIAALGPDDGARLADTYRFRPEGNWHDESHGRPTGTNIPHLEAFVPDADAAAFAAMRERLQAVRATRVRPLKDDKVLTAWNGLFIGALAEAGRALEEPTWVAAAERAADVLWRTHRRADGRLLRSSRLGRVQPTLGFLDDYAFFAGGLLELYTTTGNPRWLEAAATLTRAMLDLFGGAEPGLCYFTGHDAEALITRPVEVHDGALPSANAAAALVCLRVGRLLADPAIEAAGRAIVEHLAAQLRAQPAAYTAMLMAVDWCVYPGREIVLAGTPGRADFEALRRVVALRFLPDAVVAVHPAGDAGAPIRALLPYLAGQGPVEGQAAAHVCQDYACRAPVTTPRALADLLAKPAGQ